MSLRQGFGGNCILRLGIIPRACLPQEHCHITFRKKNEQKVHCELSDSETRQKLIKNAFEKVASRFPLVSAVKASAEENSASFHFPGHNRGEAAPASLTELIGAKVFRHDLPELPELDNLFAPEGPILEAQKLAADLFGASETWFVVGGSTCGVQAAIMATCSPGETLILPRNSHISAVSGMVLSGLVPKYVIPRYEDNWQIAGGITPLQVEEAINELEIDGRRAAAVLVVSPTYHGICSDIGAISKLCHTHKIPLIVDEAHGAHLGFHKQLPKSALSQGADIVVQSTHKVLCSLTQSSMLHYLSHLVNREKICRCLQLLQSSSPSYLLLASLDAARAQISDSKETIFNNAVELAIEARSVISKISGTNLLGPDHFPEFPATDPLRITIGTWGLGLSGFEADDILCRKFGVISELVGTRSLTLAFNLGTKREHVLRLVEGLKYLSTEYIQTDFTDVTDLTNVVPFNDFDVILSPREAFFTSKRKVRIEESVGEICGELVCPYPPGIPVLIPGERITETAVEYLVHVKRKGATISGAADHLLSSLVVCDY